MDFGKFSQGFAVVIFPAAIVLIGLAGMIGIIAYYLLFAAFLLAMYNGYKTSKGEKPLFDWSAKK